MVPFVDRSTLNPLSLVALSFQARVTEVRPIDVARRLLGAAGGGAWVVPETTELAAELPARWHSRERYYLLAEGPAMERLIRVLGGEAIHRVAVSGGKFLVTNHARSD